MHVLVVHSDPRFYHELRDLLSSQEATGAYIPNLSEIRAQIEAHFPDLIVLEQRCLSDGGEFLGHAFTAGRLQRLPVIYLTSADCERMRIEQPRRLTDLLTHVRSQAERARTQQVTQIGRLRIHAGRMRVAMDDRWVRLPPSSFVSCNTWLPTPTRSSRTAKVISVVWGAEAADDEARRDVLKVHIRHLRHMLGPDYQGYIQTLHGQGYALIDPGCGRITQGTAMGAGPCPGVKSIPIVRCRMTDCVNWDEGYCSAARINIDDEGICLTYSTLSDWVEEIEQEPEWEPEEEDGPEEDMAGLEDETEEEDVVIRGRRRWDDW